MRIAFYAPLKAPDHPVPSGDRQMARLLVKALRHAGHAVELLSTLRCFIPNPDPAEAGRLAGQARVEVGRISAAWADPCARPDLVFAYHLYYKAPDLVGWPLAVTFGLPYATAEASHAGKRQTGPWATSQALVDAAIRGALVNFCFTANDRMGLAEIVDETRLVDLFPFIEAGNGARFPRSSGGPTHLVTVAMMRPGDKLDSYRFLAAALACLAPFDWHLTIVGDGPARPAVEQAFAALPPGRLDFYGEVQSAAVADILVGADLFVWPGFNEAFGLSYLEAQAVGLPVVAVTGEGTPSVIRHGETGLLTPGDAHLYAAAIERLLRDATLREAMGQEAARFVRHDRTLPQAAARIDGALSAALGRPQAAPNKALAG